MKTIFCFINLIGVIVAIGIKGIIGVFITASQAKANIGTVPYVGSVSAASGRTGRAAVEASESPFSNPAGIAHLRGYYFTSGYGTAKQGSIANSQDIALSLTENMKDTIVPTSFCYTQSTLNAEGGDELKGRQFKLAFGNFVAPGVAFGLGINHANDRLAEDTYSQTNAQVGFLITPNARTGFALVMENIFETNSSVPEELKMNPATALAFSYNYKKFVRWKADISTSGNNSFRKPILAVGMENYTNQWLILRTGFSKDTAEEINLYSAGLGFKGPKFGLHYAYQTSPQDEKITRHSVDLAIPVW